MSVCVCMCVYSFFLRWKDYCVCVCIVSHFWWVLSLCVFGKVCVCVWFRQFRSRFLRFWSSLDGGGQLGMGCQKPRASWWMGGQHSIVCVATVCAFSRQDWILVGFIFSTHTPSWNDSVSRRWTRSRSIRVLSILWRSCRARVLPSTENPTSPLKNYILL